MRQSVNHLTDYLLLGENPGSKLDQALPCAKIINFNTDSAQWGGSGITNGEISLNCEGIELQLAPLTTHIFEL